MKGRGGHHVGNTPLDLHVRNEYFSRMKMPFRKLFEKHLNDGGIAKEHYCL